MPRTSKAYRQLLDANRPLHVLWQSMRQRCRDRNHKSWKWYGARGIKVCERWASFANFVADMGPKPPGLSIDRIDSNGDYEPANCRWVDMLTQARNKTTNRLDLPTAERIRQEYEARGRTGIRPMARVYNISPQLLRRVVRGEIWKSGTGASP